MLDERKTKLVEMRVKGLSKAEIAREIGVSRPTIYDWLKDTEVIEQIKELKKDIKDALHNRLIYNAPKYIDEIEKVGFTSPDTRSKLSALTYLTDKATDKAAIRIENVKEDEDNITDDVLSKAIASIETMGKED